MNYKLIIGVASAAFITVMASHYFWKRSNELVFEEHARERHHESIQDEKESIVEYSEGKTGELQEKSEQVGSLDLVRFAVLAVFDTSKPKMSSAVILDKQFGAYRYKIGDSIPRGYLVRDIKKDHVILEKNGNDFIFWLIPLGEIAKDDQYQQHVESISEQAVGQERNSVLVRFDLYPVTPGSANGYLVGENFPDNIMEQVDIRPGDTILSVNGYPVGESASDELARRSFSSIMTADVVILRDGISITLNYPKDIKGGRRAVQSR